MSNLNNTLEYWKKGFSVIPVKSPMMLDNAVQGDERIRLCKTPLISWKEIQEALPTEDKIKNWWTKWPEAKIAIVTGKVSGILVFDLESQETADYAEAQGGFHKTPVVLSGKGKHFYVRYPEGIRCKANKNLKIDIGADGGYIMALPRFTVRAAPIPGKRVLPSSISSPLSALPG